MSQWDYIPSEQYLRDLKWAHKKFRLENAAMHNNLAAIREVLNSATRPERICRAYSKSIHDEQAGTKAVDQSGMKGKGKQMRLYFFLEKETKGIHLIAIGDKTTQPSDNQNAKEYVLKLMKERSQTTQD